MARVMSAGESLGEPTSIWRIPAWQWAFPAALVSRLGDVVFEITVVLWIGSELAAGVSWGPAAVSGVLICAAVPVLAVAPLAGVWADRHDRHRLLLLSNLVQAIAVGSLLLVVPLQPHLGTGGTVVWIYLAVLISNSAAQFFYPARTAMIAVTIPEELRTSAFSAQMSGVAVLTIVAPPIAAPLLFAGGFGWAIAVNAASFVVSSMLLGRVRWDSAPGADASRSSFTESFREGARIIRRNVLLVAVTLALTVASFATGMINVLEVFFVTDVLGSPAAMVGLLSMAMAIGSLVGALLAPRAERRYGAEWIFVVSLVLVGVLLVGYSRSTTFWPAFVLLGCTAIPLGMVNTVFFPMIMRTLAPEVLGRTTVVLQVFPVIASLAAMAVTGWLTSTLLRGLDLRVGPTSIGPNDGAFLLAGVMMLTAGVLVARPVLASVGDRSAANP